MTDSIYQVTFEILKHGDLYESEIRKIRTFSGAFLTSALAGGLSWALAGATGGLGNSTFPDLLVLSIVFLLISFFLTLGSVIVLTQIVSAALSLLGILLVYVSTLLAFQEFLSHQIFVVASLVAGGLTIWVGYNLAQSIRGVVKFAHEVINKRTSTNGV